MYANRGPCEASTSYSHHTQQAASRYLCPQLQRARRRHTGHASSWAGVFPTFFSSPPHQPRPAPSRHPWQRLQSELCSASAGVPANEPLHDPSDRASDRDTQSGTEDDSTLAQSHGKADASGSPAPQTEQEKPWQMVPPVPWGTGKIVQVMVLWLLAYIIIGQVAVPVALSLLGLDRDDLGLRGHAMLHLCLDISQLGFTLFILWHCLKQYKPRKRGLFPFKWTGWWPLVVLAACLVFPAVDWLAQQSLIWFPVDGDAWGSHMEASLNGGDWVTNAAYFSVVSLCAPIWEEAIFRGFLLTSLMRYMKPPWAVATSSLLFAMCHFRLQTFLPLLVLGVVFSLVFLITRNLLPPMVLHSAWNFFVLANLLLKHSG